MNFAAFNLGNVDAGILVPDKVDVGHGQVLADDLSSGVAWFIVPLISTIFQQQCGTGFITETIGANSSVRLTRTPIVELKRLKLSFIYQNLLYIEEIEKGQEIGF